MANAFEIQVKALLESKQIQEQLNELQSKLKPIKINLDTGAGGSGATLAKSFESAASSATTLSSKIAGVKGEFYKLAKQEEDYTKIRRDAYQAFGKYVPSDEMKQLNQYFREQAKNADMAEKAAQKEADTFVKAAKAKQAEEEKLQKLWDASVKQQAAAAQKEANLYTKNQQSIESLTIRVEGLTDAQKARINAEQRLAEISATTDIKKQASLIQGFTKDLSAVSYGMMNFASSIDYTIKRFMEIGAITLVFRTIKNVVSDMVQAVSDLDKSLVEVQKVTDLSGKSLEVFTSRAYKTGTEVARTGQEVIDATAIFARSGYEIEDALNLSKVAMVMMNVGDGIDSTSEAATSLISVLKGYNLEANEAIKVTDLINEVSNNAAINFEDLTEGLTRTSAVFNQAGVSIENLSGLLTGANEILQNVEMSSTGLITISQRLRGITEVGEDGAVATSKLAEKFKEIANIDIFDQYGQLRDTYSILEDMSRVFPKLTKNQRQYLSELAAGKKQVKVLESLLTNWSGVEKATKAAANSAGSAERENAKYIDSIAGKSKALESSIQKLATSTIDSDFIKWILDVTKGLVDFQDSIGGLLPLVSTLVLLFSSKLAPALDSVFKILKTSIIGMKAQQTAAIEAAAGTEVLGTAAQGAATKVAILQKTLGWLSLAFTVISVGIGLWNNYKKAQEEARIESIESGNAIAEESSSLDELYSSIKDLSSIQDRTEEQESNLLQLNSDIIAKLGDRKAALENLTIGSKEYTEALKNQIIEEAKSNEASLRKSKTDAEQALKSDIPSRGFLAAPLKISNEDLGEDLRNQLVEIFNESSKTSAGKWFDFYVDRIDNSTIATLQFYDDLLKAKKAIEAESDALDHAGKDTEAANLLQTESYSELNKEIARYSEYVDDYLKATLNVEINNRRINGTLPTTVEEFEAFRAEMLKNYGVLGEYSDEFGAFIDSAFSGLSGKVGDATWKLEESNKVIEDATTKTKLLSDQIDALQSAYKTLESVIDEYNKTGNLSLDSVQSILALGDEYLQYLTNENGQLMLNEEGLQNLAVARLNELKASAMQETASKLQYLIDEKELTDGTTESVKALTEAEIEALVVQAGSSEEALALLDAMRLRVSLIDELISDTEILGNTTEEYSEKIKTATEKYDEQNSALDEAQSAYETLTSAIDEYNKTGVLSVDTLQDILSLSPEYLEMFFDQAGAMGDAEAAIYAHSEALKVAKVEELQAAAASEILAVSQNIVSGAASSTTSPLNSAAGAASNLGSKASAATPQVNGFAVAVGNLITAMGGDSSLVSSTDSQIKAILKKYEGLASSVMNIGVGTSSSKSGGGGRTSKATQQAEAISEAYDDLLNSTMKMLEQETDDRIDQLEDELDVEEELYKAEKQRIEDAIDGYKDIIDAKKESLQLDKDEKDYDDEIADKNKEIAEIQNRLLELSFDTSESSKAEQLKLQEELSSKQKDLSDTQYDRSVELSKNALDNEYELYKSNQNAKIDLLDEAFEATKLDYEDRIELLKTYLEEENTIRSQAMDLISGKTEDYYDRLFNWNQKYGKVSNDILQSIINKSQETISTTSSSSSKKKSTKSASTKDGSSSTIAGTLASLVGKVGGVLLSSLGIFHEGLDSGFVGDVKGNETFVKALKGEAFVTEKQQDNFVNKVLPSMLNNASSGNNINCDNLLSINVAGNLDSKSEANVISAVNSQFKELNKILAGNGLVRKANGFA